MKQIEEDGYKFTFDERSGYYLSSKKIDGKRLRYHVYFWIKNNGPIPPGFAVHHKDENKENNTLENFVLVSDIVHCRIHAKERMADPVRFENQKESLKRIQERAAEWHASLEGREWHKKHYEEFKEKLHSEIIKKCIFCGKEYKTKKHGALFCSNSCCQKYNYREKKDFVEKTCQLCGKTFLGNKYRETPFCSRSCGARFGHMNKKPTP